MLDELRAMRKVLEALLITAKSGRVAPPTDDKVTLATVPTEFVMGKPDAPLTMVKFTDLQCPFCREFHVSAFERIKREYIDTGRLRFISRDLPQTEIHPLAMAAARASRCAGEQGRYWEMRHAILLNNAKLSAPMFAAFASDLRLDMMAFAACTIATARIDEHITRDRADGEAAGMDGTPGFVIGLTRPQGLEGVRISGAVPFETFDAALKAIEPKR